MREVEPRDSWRAENFLEILLRPASAVNNSAGQYWDVLILVSVSVLTSV